MLRLKSSHSNFPSCCKNSSGGASRKAVVEGLVALSLNKWLACRASFTVPFRDWTILTKHEPYEDNNTNTTTTTKTTTTRRLFTIILETTVIGARRKLPPKQRASFKGLKRLTHAGTSEHLHSQGPRPFTSHICPGSLRGSAIDRRWRRKWYASRRLISSLERSESTPCSRRKTTYDDFWWTSDRFGIAFLIPGIPVNSHLMSFVFAGPGTNFIK